MAKLLLFCVVFSVVALIQQQLVFCINPQDVKGDCQGVAKKACLNALNAFESSSNKWSLYCTSLGKDKYGSQINSGKCLYGYKENSEDRNSGLWNCSDQNVKTWCDNFAYNTPGDSYCQWSDHAVLCHVGQ